MLTRCQGAGISNQTFPQRFSMNCMVERFNGNQYVLLLPYHPTGASQSYAGTWIFVLCIRRPLQLFGRRKCPWVIVGAAPGSVGPLQAFIWGCHYHDCFVVFFFLASSVGLVGLLRCSLLAYFRSLLSLYLCMCVCVCVCLRETERGRDH